jgi:arylamine N-acetyltransferase
MEQISMQTPPLDPTLAHSVLDYLHIEASATPSLTFLDKLINAYVRRVPWESASRIVKRAHERDTKRCPRLPQEFWQDTLTRGAGGTCFESTYAFFALLRALGYDGYLTINDMDILRGCHAASVINVDGQRWLVDVGLPIHIALPLDFTFLARRSGPFHTYTVYSCGDLCYEIERNYHSKPYCFTLVDKPVSDEDYCAAMAADYGSAGLFLDRVIITRIINDRVWRFYGQPDSTELESFKNGTRTVHPLGSNIVETLSQIFEMDAALIAEALQIMTNAVAA